MIFSKKCKVCISHSVGSDSLQAHGLQPIRLFCPWNSPCKNTGVDCHALLQGIFPTQGLNLGLPHCRQVLYCLSHQASKKKKKEIKKIVKTSFKRIKCFPRNFICPRKLKSIHRLQKHTVCNKVNSHSIKGMF